MPALNDPQYLAFPFRLVNGAPAVCGRQQHVREQIEQVLFTNPRERVFRPEFGAGVRQLLFEPNNRSLRDTLLQRLMHSLSEALLGEVDPRSLAISFDSSDASLQVLIEYQLATINRQESYRFDVGTEA